MIFVLVTSNEEGHFPLSRGCPVNGGFTVYDGPEEVVAYEVSNTVMWLTWTKPNRYHGHVVAYASVNSSYAYAPHPGLTPEH